ncbi:MAG: 2-hydroxyhepta-2,4-diene-1,7-dioate isomerase [Confluentimicrobium sp.]|uniref:fumarylacetoacetate hydrolase family protein n=1 Tax=Actibacterium sp. TaxID=1872125 RepID=UPI000C62778E|nr:fumarylacetoacetate hydrolase family protein [Actibacterium sp.]MBC56690.1 2-hydroxyhepta-2,4-diene-1,7-dioate isomerase [Actibacterium sp.]
MKICRFGENRFGVVTADGVVDVTEVFAALPASGYPFPRHDVMIAALPDLLPKLAKFVEGADVIPLDQIKLALPVANPGKLVAAPVNYAKHLQEVRDQAELNHANEAHMRQIKDIGLFLKANSSLIGPGEAVEISRPDRRNDHEIELAVVIGKTGKNISAADALDYVAAYTIGLDMTVRGPEDRSFRKSLDTYSVLGPWLVTADEIPDPATLGFELTVNGETRQKAHTSDLVLSVPELIEYASSFYTLHPGDVIFTGTPEGVGQVHAGDTIHARIDGIGELTVQVTGAAQAKAG